MPAAGETGTLTDRPMDPAQIRLLHTRSAGNPFLARELVRLFAGDGAAALATVPAGVRDVLLHRVGQLPGQAGALLRLAAVQGTDVDLDVLVRLAGDEDAALAGVEDALLAGLLVEEGPRGLRFAHALVQETLYQDVPGIRRTRWHAATADALSGTRPAEVEGIAHHLLRAGDQAPPERVAGAAAAAARRAEQRSAPHEAARLWRATVDALDRSSADGGGPRARLEALTGLVRALAVTGDLPQARRLRAQALTAAEQLGDPLVTAAMIGSSDVPAVWTANDDEALSARIVAVAERTLDALPAGRRAERGRLLTSIALERRADDGPRGDRAAREAERIARELADPALLALALDARFLQSFQRAGLAPERARIGEELLALSAEDPGMVTSEVLGHLVLLQARSALGDLSAARRHAAAVDGLADRHGLPLVGVFTAWWRALELAVTGHPDTARAAYRAAAARLTGSGMSGLEHGLPPLAQLGLTALERTPGPVDDADWGPYEPWARPLVLLGRGDDDAAVAALRAVPDSPHDLLLEARTCLHAMAAVRLGDRPRMERLADQLLPAAGELAGAGSGLLTVGPTALHLGRLYRALGREEEAVTHLRRAAQVAGRAGAPHWAAAARST